MKISLDVSDVDIRLLELEVSDVSEFLSGFLQSRIRKIRAEKIRMSIQSRYDAGRQIPADLDAMLLADIESGVWKTAKDRQIEISETATISTS